MATTLPCKVVAFGVRRRQPPLSKRQLTLRSEEHTSELQSPCNLVCRLLLEKKKKPTINISNAVRQTSSKQTSHRALLLSEYQDTTPLSFAVTLRPEPDPSTVTRLRVASTRD